MTFSDQHDVTPQESLRSSGHCRPSRPAGQHGELRTMKKYLVTASLEFTIEREVEAEDEAAAIAHVSLYDSLNDKEGFEQLRDSAVWTVEEIK